ncbi:MAG: CDP-alcohol phosphatidyltransferase family protein [Anaerolineaceae bacterium]
MKDKDGKMERKNDILLGPLERPTLQWLASHMPAWVTPDTMTVIGILASTLTLVSYIMVGRGDIRHNPWMLVASLGFFLNWFGDSLDGTLARYRHKERPRYGYFVDHSVDGYTAVAMFLGIGFAKISRLDVAAFGAIGYLLSMIVVYLKTHVTGVFEMTTIKIGPTEIRIMAIILNVVLFFTGVSSVKVPGIAEEQTIGTIVIAVMAVALFGYYVYETVRVSYRLALLDGKRLERRLEKEAKKLEKEQKKAAKKKVPESLENASGQV